MNLILDRGQPSLSKLRLRGSGSVCSFSLNISAPFNVECNLSFQFQTEARCDVAEAETDPAVLRMLLLADMFSFLQLSAELQEQVLHFIYRDKIKACTLKSA